MFLKKIAPAAALALVLAGGTGLATASTAAKEPAKVYGVCVVAKSGAVRVLEAKALTKSRYGKCKTGETRLLMPGVDGVPAAAPGPKGDVGPAGVKGDIGPAGPRGPKGSKKMPDSVEFKRGDKTEVCTLKSTTAAGVPQYDCADKPA